MTFINQWKIIKQNWLIVTLILIILFIPIFSNNNFTNNYLRDSYSKNFGYTESGKMEFAIAPSYSSRVGSTYYSYNSNEDFAPNIDDRKITKSSSLTTEVEQGKFKDTETKLKAIITATDSFLLNENSNKNDIGWKSYYHGYYQIKVESKKYNSIIKQFKNLGVIKSFNENMKDITGSYANLELELKAEKARLQRYENIYSEVKDVADKIELSDKIFNQERKIEYLQDSLSNKDSQVSYSTITINLQEKQTEYANIVLIKFSSLIRSLVNSFNNILSLLFWAVPWLILGTISWIIVKKVRNDK